ncbi:MAG: extracellular solute-binding protein, partial [Bdellovibrionales bacterium]|nr:extracellular solute-binding protein [Bdellovibrionales bacterium]
ELKNPQGFYSTLSIPVMVMIYNNESVPESSAPKTFKELTEARWKNKVTTGSPLASGTTFTTVAMLQDKYGWEYLQSLRKNELIAQGGNSSVISRVQNKERPVGVVLLENVLRFQDTDKRLKIVYPNDGVILQSNVVAITKKDGKREAAQKVVDWMYGKDGQEAMVHSYMYSPLLKYDPPKGAPKFDQLQTKNFAWTNEFIEKTVKSRTEIKEKFAEIMYQ